jgi:hypothetical protein
LTETDLGINGNDLEVNSAEAERSNMEMEVNSAETEENGMEMEVDEANDMEVSNLDPPCMGHNRDGDAELVCVRIFGGAKDWEPINEMELRLESCGGLNLALLQEKLGGQIQVSYGVFWQ